ncbi:MAG: 1,4-alpha-glucan branching protein GlgB [Candidatus Latescibacteria bacterium]|jgi:1,4-alpha-glucan branching enzyme|nr:1,4-alpha-glucan branching enzyme [Gemmatimonadaceae bacterium]MDP6019027.1 1,4-alpha-glucan branching protein GlgB [Candidatus Latescibacterota bacterium]
MEDRDRLLAGRHADPFAYLGIHADPTGGQVIRAYLPGARQVTVHGLADEAPVVARHTAEGMFEASLPDRTEAFAYELGIDYGDGFVHRTRDPYSFLPMVTEFDQHLFNEGRHHRIYEVLGAHEREVDGTTGVHFVVWAPNAPRVSVIGDFNGWDGRRHPMRSLGASGLWELFLPGLGAGTVYKFEVVSPAGQLLTKADPCARATEVPPQTASIVAPHLSHPWQDDDWIAARQQKQWLQEPLSIYEVHAGSWRHAQDGGPMGWRDLAQALGDHVVDLGFTHVELMPIAEHPFDGSWGYQGAGYFAPTSRFGQPDDFAWFVDHMHGRGIGVIVDWVPGHFPTDAHGLARFDGTALYEHEDPRQGAHPDWGTLIFNFGRAEVCSFLLSNARFWLDRYHVDGLRVDAVASMLYLDYSREAGEWIPNRDGGRENLEAIEFLKQMNILVHGDYPGVLTLAEESTAWPAVSQPTYSGGLGFGFKWNMGWMNDMLQYMSRDPIHRRHHQSDLTFGMLYAYTEHFVLPLSHDEVVHGKGSLLDKMPGNEWQKFANLRLLYAYMFTFPGKKLLFMGGEFGQWQEWNYKRDLEWACLQYGPHAGVQSLVRDLNSMYRSHPCLYATDADPAGFEWIDCHDAESSAIAFERRSGDDRPLVVICNFTPIAREGYRVGLPRPGRWVENLNTDAGVYGGSGAGNDGVVLAEPEPWHHRRWSAAMRLPPLSVLVLQPDADSD